MFAAHTPLDGSKYGSDSLALPTLRVVIPLDGSHISENALGIGQTLAGALHGSIELVQVIDPSVSSSVSHDERVRQAQDYLHIVAANLNSDESAEIRVLTGNPVDELLDLLRDASNTVVAMSTHGRGGLQRFLFGSVADKVIRGVNVPVAVVRHPSKSLPSMRHITVPLDGSEMSASALPMAMSLNQDDCIIGLVRVIDMPHMHENLTLKYGSIWSDPDLASGITLDAEDEAREAMIDVAQRLRAAGCKVSWEVRVGRPGDEIIRAAETTGSDLILMATHGLGGLRRWAFGSVTDDVIHRSNLPVLVIPPNSDWPTSIPLHASSVSPTGR